MDDDIWRQVKPFYLPFVDSYEKGCFNIQWIKESCFVYKVLPDLCDYKMCGYGASSTCEGRDGKRSGVSRRIADGEN